MRGTVKIGDRDVVMVTNGATPFLYKKVFRKDFLATTQKEDLDVYTELGYIMAMQAERPLAELVNGLSIEDFYKWVEEFEAMDVVNCAADIFRIYQAQSTPTSTAKKKR